MIGKLPDTLHDRSVVLELKRRLPSEPITPFRPDRADSLDALAKQAARWVQDHAGQVAAADPEMPAGIYNREADNWRPLLAIAHAAGGDWPERARKAVAASHDAAEDDEIRAILLADIKTIFAEKDTDRLSSEALAEALHAIEGRSWAEYGKRAKPISKNQVASHLKRVGVKPEVVRIGSETPRGYLLSQFAEAFERYLNPEGDSRPQQCNKCDEIRTSDTFQTATPESDVAVQKSEKSNNDGLCCGVAVQKAENGSVRAEGEPGLSWRTINQLAREIDDWAYEHRDPDTGDIDLANVEAEARRRLMAAGVLPEAVEIELERVMRSLFETREAARASRGPR